MTELSLLFTGWPPAGRARFLVARAPCRARFSPISVHGPAGFAAVSVHDVAGAYTAQRTLRRFPYTTRHGGDCRTLYTGDPVRAGVCTQVAAGTEQTPVGTGLLVRKVRLCTLETLFGRDFVHWPSRVRRLCTLATPFGRDFVHRGRPALYKPPSEPAS